MSLDELIFEPAKITRAEIDEAVEAIKKFMEFLDRVKELALYYNDDEMLKQIRSFKFSLKLELKLFVKNLSTREEVFSEESDAE